MLDTPKKPYKVQINNPDAEEMKEKPKKSTNWSDKLKEKFGNLVYKVNHGGSALSQYSKLDYKNWHKKPIRLMWNHVFTDPTWKDGISEVFRNIILFTYRKDFAEPLDSISKKSGRPKKLNSDFGWGCMIRCGQMMLANAILLHWKRTLFNKSRKVITSSQEFDNSQYGLDIDSITELSVYENIEKDIISKFLDFNSNKKSPFSIHEITERGLEWFHKIAGDWYGTNSISQVLKELNHHHKPFEDFEICVFNNGMLFKDDLINSGSELVPSEQNQESKEEDVLVGTPDSFQFDNYFRESRHGNNQSGNGEELKEAVANKSQHSGGGSSNSPPDFEKKRSNTDNFQGNHEFFYHKNEKRKWNKCVLVIVNTMLGMKKIPEEAYDQISKIFEIPQMVGILGGKGKFGLYFVGIQKDNMILLDPHLNQETVIDEEQILQNRETFRWKYIRTIKIKKLDPWIGIGFLVRSHSEYKGKVINSCIIKSYWVFLFPFSTYWQTRRTQ